MKSVEPSVRPPPGPFGGVAVLDRPVNRHQGNGVDLATPQLPAYHPRPPTPIGSGLNRFHLADQRLKQPGQLVRIRDMIDQTAGPCLCGQKQPLIDQLPHRSLVLVPATGDSLDDLIVYVIQQAVHHLPMGGGHGPAGKGFAGRFIATGPGRTWASTPSLSSAPLKNTTSVARPSTLRWPAGRQHKRVGRAGQIVFSHACLSQVDPHLFAGLAEGEQ